MTEDSFSSRKCAGDLPLERGAFSGDTSGMIAAFLESDDRVTVECVDELPIFWRRIGSAFVYSSPVFALVIPRRGPGNCCLCEVSRTIAGALTPASPGNFSPAPSVGRCSRTSKLQKRTCSRVIGATDRYQACRSVESIHCCSLYAKLRKLLNQDKKR